MNAKRRATPRLKMAETAEAGRLDAARDGAIGASHQTGWTGLVALLLREKESATVEDADSTPLAVAAE